MQYNGFAHIENIEDVIPFLNKHFIRSEKQGVVYLNYKYNTPEVFPPADLKSGLYRREFRGIAFDRETGRILSRPFHKFFNLGERDDIEVDWDIPHKVEVKLDGSMIRPIQHKEGIRLATKMGVTDQSILAEKLVATKENYQDFFSDCVKNNITPIFEYVGPDNKIILDYGVRMLTLLACRNNFTGDYIPVKRLAEQYNLSSVGNFDIKLDDVAKAEKIEGVVVSFLGGERVKLKTEWYVTRHKGKEAVDNERAVVKLFLDEDLDDVLPYVSSEDKSRINRFVESLQDTIEEWAKAITESYKLDRKVYSTKKDFALNSDDILPFLRSATFAMWDNEDFDVERYILEFMSKNVSTNKKYKELKEILVIGDM